MANPNPVLKPENLTPWPKGVSGNPSGLPNGRSITARLRQLLDGSEVEGKDTPDKKVSERLAEVIVKGALDGDVRLISLVVDRVDGRVPETLQLNHSGLNPDTLDGRLASLAARLAERGDPGGDERCGQNGVHV